MLDIRRLKVLRSVIAAGSVSGAAQALGYTPSSISQQISALQRETGLQLFEHVGRGIRPTAAAELLDAHAGSVFDQLAQAEQAVADYRQGRMSRLRMEYFSTAGRAMIAPAVAAFSFRNPGTQVELHLQQDGDPAHRISRGEIDVALAVGPNAAPAEGISRTHLADDPFMVVLPADHPLSAHEEISIRELAGLPWVTHEWPLGPCSDHVLRACAAMGFAPHYAVECNDVETAQGLIEAGAGVGVMPRMGLSHPHPGVVVLPLEEPAPRRRVYALHGSAPKAAEMTRILLSCADALTTDDGWTKPSI